MSSVTDVIFMCAGMDQEQWEAAMPAYFARVDHLAGGPKGMESQVYLAGTNYLDLEGLMSSIAAVEWIFPERVVLLTRHENCIRPTVWHMSGGRLESVGVVGDIKVRMVV